MPDHQPQPFEFVFLRHGESEGNVEGIFQGQSDFPLSRRGQQQAQALGKYWKRTSVTFNLIISSTLSRASQTAEIISASLNVPVELQAEWMERNNGQLAGMRFDEAMQRSTRPSFIHPYLPIGETGESQWELFLRAGRNVQNLLNRQPGRYLVVSHGGILNMAMYAILGLTPHANFTGPRFRFHNTAFATLRYQPQQHEWTIEGVNQRPHWQNMEPNA